MATKRTYISLPQSTVIVRLGNLLVACSLEYGGSDESHDLNTLFSKKKTFLSSMTLLGVFQVPYERYIRMTIDY